MAKGYKTGGRTKGVPNKATAEIKTLAQQYGEEALERLVNLMRGEDPRVAFAACQEIISRGFGKPTQVVEAEVTHNYVARIPEVARSTDEWLQNAVGRQTH